jgi:hypothetical protein
MACCDCDLVHTVHVKADANGVQLQAFRNHAETKALRAERAGQFVADAKKKRRRDPDDDEIDDGRGVRTPMLAMDTKPKPVKWISPISDAEAKAITDAHARAHQPHYLSSTSREVVDAQARARESRLQWLDRTRTAWRPPNSYIPPTPTPTTVGVSDRAKAIAAREAKIRTMCDAWRTPTPVLDNPGYLQPQTPERQRLWGAMRAAGARVDGPQPDPAAVQARRDAQFAQRCRDLENAWRSPAAAANAVERQRRLVTHEDHRQ